MKVGIVTEPLVGNYGGIIQNYALQRALAECGYDSITLRYMSSLSFPRYCLYVGKNVLTGLRGRKIALKPYRRFTKVPDNIAPFINSYISMTKPMTCYSASAIKRYGIDALVVGSDQVWRKEYNRNLYDMFLAFAEGEDICRIAYAASFGTSEWTYTPDMTARCSELLSKFDAVSVREVVGADMCRTHLGVTPEVVSDPTLLLCRNDYESICKKVPKHDRHYLLTYFLDNDAVKTDFAGRIAKNHSLELESMTVSYNEKSTVEEWIARFRDADYVITDSFHGTVFSIIFGKQFLAVANSSRGSDRFVTLLSKLDLRDRLVCDLPSLSEEPDVVEIDYEKVESRMEVFRTESLAFLKNSLNGK